MWLHRLRRSEDGIALLAAIGISLVILVLVFALLSLAVRSNRVTSNDRSRAQGLQSADGVVSQIIDGLSRSICVPDVALGSVQVGGSSIGRYQGVVRVPPEAGRPASASLSWNPNAASSAGCTTPLTQATDRVITAWGYGATGSITRKLEVRVTVSTNDWFRYACYAGSPSASALSAAGELRVQGDCYARSVAPDNRITAARDLITPGTLTTATASQFGGDVRAGGAVTLGPNTVVQGRVVSAESSVTLGSGASVLRDVIAGTTISADSSNVIRGFRCPASPGAPGCPTNAPQAVGLPSLACGDADVACWSGLYPGMVTVTSSSLATLLAANAAALQGSYFVSDSGPVDLPSSATVGGPLTIISAGKVGLGGSLQSGATCVTTPASCLVTIVSTSSSSNAIQLGGTSGFESAPAVTLLLYSKGTIEATSDAPLVRFTGAAYAERITTDAFLTDITWSSVLQSTSPRIVNWTNRFRVDTQSWREIPA